LRVDRLVSDPHPVTDLLMLGPSQELKLCCEVGHEPKRVGVTRQHLFPLESVSKERFKMRNRRDDCCAILTARRSLCGSSASLGWMSAATRRNQSSKDFKRWGWSAMGPLARWTTSRSARSDGRTVPSSTTMSVLRGFLIAMSMPSSRIVFCVVTSTTAATDRRMIASILAV